MIHVNQDHLAGSGKIRKNLRKSPSLPPRPGRQAPCSPERHYKHPERSSQHKYHMSEQDFIGIHLIGLNSLHCIWEFVYKHDNF